MRTRMTIFPRPGAAPSGPPSLRAEVALVPEAVTNTLMITHNANIVAAFGAEAQDLADGEALIYRPDGRGKAVLVARVKIEDWPKLAAAR